MKEKFGFIYIWFDKKRKRYYVGSHQGVENDGYICSSNWMRDVYRRRPDDFKRRIIKRMVCTRKELFEEENKWLSLIKKEELGKKYYNLHQNIHHYLMDPDYGKSTREKMSLAKKGKKRAGNPENWKHSEETKQKLSKQQTGQKKWPNGRSFSEETKEKMRLAKIGYVPWNKGTKGLQKAWNKGLTKSDSRVAKNIESLLIYIQGKI